MEIVERATKFEADMTALYTRMDKDYDLYNLKPWVPPPILADFDHIRTSNEPRTFADKVIAFLSASKIVPSIPFTRGDPELEALNNDKERGGIGMLAAGDDLFEARTGGRLQSATSFYLPIRGFSTGRGTLAKEPDGQTYVDLMPWDPRYTSWEIGSKGVRTMTHHVQRSLSEVKALYDLPDGVEADTNGLVNYYDHYDEENNVVVASTGQPLKRPRPHGLNRPPTWLTIVGPQPFIVVNGDTQTAWEHYGESIYHSSRGTFYDVNYITSVWMVIVARSAQQGLKIFSEDGTKKVKGNPFLSGADMSLRTGKEDVVPLGLLELAKETPALFGLISAELQRGTLPATVYGQLALAISGFAIKQLREGVMSVLNHCIIGMESVYRQILTNLSDQYASGYFLPMRVEGYARNKNYFSGVVPPEVVKLGGKWKVEVYPDLPQDDLANIQMAQLARGGPPGMGPLLADKTLREDHLKLQDAALEGARIKEQMGETGDAVVATYEMMKAAEGRGDMQQAKMHAAKLQLLMLEIQARLMVGQAAMPQLAAAGQGGETQPGKGFSPEVSPRPAQGFPPSGMVEQQGPLAPAGAPRPGARNGGTPEVPQEGI